MNQQQRTAVAIRHVAFEDLGLLAPVLQEAGWTMSYREAARDDLTAPELAQADLIVVLGGPISAYETDIYPFLAAETALLEKRLAAGKATLSICLGCQLMAQALGARVYSGGKKEIGWGDVNLTEPGKASVLAPLAAPSGGHSYGRSSGPFLENTEASTTFSFSRQGPDGQPVESSQLEHDPARRNRIMLRIPCISILCAICGPPGSSEHEVIRAIYCPPHVPH